MQPISLNHLGPVRVTSQNLHNVPQGMYDNLGTHFMLPRTPQIW